MRIAVTYENGDVFQHFGHTETFKVYEVKDGRIVSSELIGSDGSGHEALAGLLKERKINVLIIRNKQFIPGVEIRQPYCKIFFCFNSSLPTVVF